MMKGQEVQNPTALSKKECECGVWFYTNEKMMKDILGAQLFDRLDKHHENWHKNYLSIYEIFFKEDPKKKKGLISKIFGKGKIDSLTLDKAKLYFSELQNATDELLIASESAMRRVSALKESKFTHL